MPSPVVLQEKTIVQPGRSQMLVQLHTSVYSVFPNFRDNVDDFIAVAEAEFDGRQIVVFDLSDIFGPQSRQFLFRRGDTVYQDRHTAIGRGDLIGLASARTNKGPPAFSIIQLVIVPPAVCQSNTLLL